MFVSMIALNFFIHVLMYTYYFTALFGPRVQRKLIFVKQNLTFIQMVKTQTLFAEIRYKKLDLRKEKKSNISALQN